MEYEDRIFHLIDSIHDFFLHELLKKIFDDNEILKKFVCAPASVKSKHHHSYLHGLAEHTFGMIALFEKFYEYYDRKINFDNNMMLTAILLHDIGKIDLYGIDENVKPYFIQKEGKNLNHVQIGVDIVEKFIEMLNKIMIFPSEIKKILFDAIKSHQGKKKWDSIKEPETNLEWVLHSLDMIDSQGRIGIPSIGE